tara:strand:+ start:1382 stop:1963 length:582 start_codon:yes stop_codon:yes gene_type:complete
MYASQIFADVGISYPTPNFHGGGTLLMATNSTANTMTRGEIARIRFPGHDSDLGLGGAGIAELLAASAPAAGLNGIQAASYTYGVLQQEIAAGGEGVVMLRGLTAAWCEKAALGSNINVTTLSPLTQGLGNDGTNPTSVITGTLSSVRDVATADYFKVLAHYRGETAITVDNTAVLRPVYFNGVEGFHHGIAP